MTTSNIEEFNISDNIDLFNKINHCMILMQNNPNDKSIGRYLYVIKSYINTNHKNLSINEIDKLFDFDFLDKKILNVIASEKFNINNNIDLFNNIDSCMILIQNNPNDKLIGRYLHLINRYINENHENISNNEFDKLFDFDFLDKKILNFIASEKFINKDYHSEKFLNFLQKNFIFSPNLSKYIRELSDNNLLDNIPIDFSNFLCNKFSDKLSFMGKVNFFNYLVNNKQYDFIKSNTPDLFDHTYFISYKVQFPNTVSNELDSIFFNNFDIKKILTSFYIFNENNLLNYLKNNPIISNEEFKSLLNLNCLNHLNNALTEKNDLSIYFNELILHQYNQNKEDFFLYTKCFKNNFLKNFNEDEINKSLLKLKKYEISSQYYINDFDRGTEITHSILTEISLTINQLQFLFLNLDIANFEDKDCFFINLFSKYKNILSNDFIENNNLFSTNNQFIPYLFKDKYLNEHINKLIYIKNHLTNDECFILSHNIIGNFFNDTNDEINKNKIREFISTLNEDNYKNFKKIVNFYKKHYQVDNSIIDLRNTSIIEKIKFIDMEVLNKGLFFELNDNYNSNKVLHKL